MCAVMDPSINNVPVLSQSVEAREGEDEERLLTDQSNHEMELPIKGSHFNIH